MNGAFYEKSWKIILEDGLNRKLHNQLVQIIVQKEGFEKDRKVVWTFVQTKRDVKFTNFHKMRGKGTFLQSLKFSLFVCIGDIKVYGVCVEMV